MGSNSDRKSFTMRLATADDVAAISEVYFSAFGKTYILQECFPQASQEVQEFVRQGKARDLEDPRVRLYVVVDPSAPVPPSSGATAAPADSQKRIIGFAKWVVPLTPGEGDWDKEDPTPTAWPKDGNPAAASEFFDGLDRTHREVMGQRRHWFLELLAVHQDHQGRGASSLLLGWGLEQADADGVPCFLDATSAGKRVYERFGFKAVSTQEYGGGREVQTSMVREPNI